MDTISIGLLCTILGVIFSYVAFQNNMKKDLKSEATQNTSMAMQLDYISRGVDDIKLDIKSTNNEVDKVKETLIRHDESIKSAHKRLNKIDGEGFE